MKERHTIALLIIGIVLTAGVLSFFTLTGQTIAVIDKTCADSDNGEDFTIKGTITSERGVSYTDYCLSQYKLKEYYCEEGVYRGYGIKSIQEKCDCLNGVCLD